MVKSKTKKNNSVKKEKSNSNFILNNFLLFSVIFIITYFISNLLFDFGSAFYYVFPVSAAFISVFMNIINKFVTPESKSASYIYIVFSALIVTLSGLSILAAHNIIPFGNNTIIILDAPQQYLPFNLKLKDMIENGENLLYSHDLGLGADFLGMFSYYLSSIYNIILLIFPKSMYILSYSLMTYLKFVTIPITFGIFYQRTYKRKDFTVVIFSLAYSLMSYVVIQITNIMWIDCIILFPLIIMYLNETLETGKFYKYSIFLALAIISNFYIAYMICIYLVLYYVAYMFINTEKFVLMEQLKKLWKFAYSSLLAAGTAGIMLIPTIYNLSKTLNLNNSYTSNISPWNYNPLMSFERFFSFMKASINPNELPNIYCSVFVLFLLTLFWFCKGISLKKKLSYSVITVFLLFSLSFYPIDKAWHGFHDPIFLPGRYSFLVSFTVIITVIDVINNLKGINLKALFIELIFIPLFIVMYIVKGSEALISIIGTAVFLISYVTIMIMYKKGRLIKQTALMISLLLVFLEMTTSAIISRNFYPNQYITTENLHSFEALNNTTSELEKLDDGLYRTETSPRITFNDGIYTNSESLSYFSSTNNGKAVKFMCNVGYRSNLLNVYMSEYYLPFIDSVLGLKYIIFINSTPNSPYLKHLFTKTYYDNTYSVYENELFTGLGYALPNEIKNWDINSNDPFECQNRLSRILTGKDVYEKVPIDFNVNGLKIKDDGSLFFDESNNNLNLKIDVKTNGNYYISYYVQKCDSFNLLTANNNISQNNLNGVDEKYIKDLGKLQAGQEITYSVTGGKGETAIYLYKLNEEVLSESIEKINTAPSYEIETFKNTEIKGSVNMKESGTLFLSIVNDGGFTATVDGKETEITEIADCFIGIPLETGEHTIELHYHNYSVLIGVLVTLLSIGIIIFIALMQKNKDKLTTEG